MPPILIIILSLIVLILLHELGHFWVAKKCDVKVEEFGVGIPPRIFGKKIGETIYSVNLIPFGGFVRLYGEDRKVNDKRSFSSKPIYQRALIVSAGVAAFFVIAFFIFSLHSAVGVRTAITEEEFEKSAYPEAEIFITETVADSPAKNAGINPGDVLQEIDGEIIEKPTDAVAILEEKKGEKIDIKVMRGEETLSFSLTPREDYTEREGSVGVAMVLTTKEKVPWFYAPIEGLVMTGRMTVGVLKGFYTLLISFLTGKELPPGMEVGGPVAIIDIGAGAFTRGISDFLQFLGTVTISLAILNILPIPALDGGRLMFLGIEKIKGEPISEKTEYYLNTLFFFLLIGLMIFITVKDLGL